MIWIYSPKNSGQIIFFILSHSIHSWQSQNSNSGQSRDTLVVLRLMFSKISGIGKVKECKKVRRRKASACLICAATFSESSVLVTFLCLSWAGFPHPSLPRSPLCNVALELHLAAPLQRRHPGLMHASAANSLRARRGTTGCLAIPTGLRRCQARGRSGISSPQG